MKHLLKLSSIVHRNYSSIYNSTKNNVNEILSNNLILLPTAKFHTTKLSMAHLKLDSFKYAITYPNLDGRGSKDLALIDLQTDTKVPVVLLFGWGGAKDKNVAKYSKIYEDQGMITVRYTPPNKYTFLQYSKMMIVGLRLLNLIQDELSLSNHPILVHCFSNTGSISYIHMSKALMQSPKQSLKIKGIIFDSTPGERRIFRLFKVIKEMGRGMVIATPLAFVITMGIKIWWTLEEIYNLFYPNWTGGYLRVMKYLVMEKFRWPQHCIYSKADDKIDYNDVDNFVKSRRKFGVDVTTLCFEDSEHVQHYLKYKKEYTQSILSFADKCLNGTKGQENSQSKVTSKM